MMLAQQLCGCESSFLRGFGRYCLENNLPEDSIRDGLTKAAATMPAIRREIQLVKTANKFQWLDDAANMAGGLINKFKGPATSQALSTPKITTNPLSGGMGSVGTASSIPKPPTSLAMPAGGAQLKPGVPTGSVPSLPPSSGGIDVADFDKGLGFRGRPSVYGNGAPNMVPPKPVAPPAPSSAGGMGAADFDKGLGFRGRPSVYGNGSPNMVPPVPRTPSDSGLLASSGSMPTLAPSGAALPLKPAAPNPVRAPGPAHEWPAPRPQMPMREPIAKAPAAPPPSSGYPVPPSPASAPTVTGTPATPSSWTVPKPVMDDIVDSSDKAYKAWLGSDDEWAALTSSSKLDPFRRPPGWKPPPTGSTHHPPPPGTPNMPNMGGGSGHPTIPPIGARQQGVRDAIDKGMSQVGRVALHPATIGAAYGATNPVNDTYEDPQTRWLARLGGAAAGGLAGKSMPRRGWIQYPAGLLAATQAGTAGSMLPAVGQEAASLASDLSGAGADMPGAPGKATQMAAAPPAAAPATLGGDTAELDAMEAQMIQGLQNGQQPEPQQVQDLMTRRATAAAAQSGKDPAQMAAEAQALAQKLSSDGTFDQTDLQQIAQTDAGKEFVQKMGQDTNAATPQDLMSSLGNFFRENPWQAGMLMLGVPMALWGLSNMLGGDGGLGSIVAMLGGAGLAAGGAGMLGGNPIPGMPALPQLGGMLGMGGPKPPGAQPPAAPPPADAMQPMSVPVPGGVSPALNAAYDQAKTQLQQWPLNANIEQVVPKAELPQWVSMYKANPQQARSAFQQKATAAGWSPSFTQQVMGQIEPALSQL